MKLSAKMKLRDLLNGPEELEKPVFLDFGEKVPKNHKGLVFRFVDFRKKNESKQESK